MVKLELINKNNYEYHFKDENENKYVLNLEFFDLEQQPNIGDYIYIHPELLNKKHARYSTSYTFGNLENKYGKKDIDLKDIDAIKLVSKDKEILLKRLYG